MGDASFIMLAQNLILIGLIFWLLTDLTEYFYSKKQHTNKKLFYECGFRSISDIKITININFQMVAVFLILYDIEFIFLICLALNMNNLTLIEFLIAILFFMSIVYSLYYDWQFNALNWQF
jgi:NADH:ubiquinone oxidoreductase subunit 3 (subunit A)